MKNIKELIYIIIPPFIIYLIVTYPLFLYFNSSIYSDYFGDSVGLLLFKKDNYIENFVDLIFTLFSSLLSNIVIYNLYVALGFILTYIASYYLMKYLLKSDKLVILYSHIFAILITICPLRLKYAMEWPSHSLWAFLIFELLILLIWINQKLNYRIMFGISLMVFLASFQNPYHGILSMLLLAFFCFVKLYKTKSIYEPLIVSLLSSLFILPILFIYTIPIYNNQSILDTAVRKASDRFAFSARPWDYIIPDIYNPITGDIALKLRFQIWDTKPYYLTEVYFPKENTLYIGLINLGIIFTSIIISLKKKNSIKIPSNILLLGIIDIIFFIFSMPPYVSIGGYYIYFPSYFTYNLLPQLRVFTRFGVITIITMLAISTIYLSKLANNIKERYKKLFIIIIALFLILDYINIPPFHSLSLDLPKFYDYINIEGKNYIEIPEPLDYSDVWYDSLTQSTLKQITNDLLTNKEVNYSNLYNINACNILNKNKIDFIIYNNNKLTTAAYLSDFKSGKITTRFKIKSSETWGSPIFLNHIPKTEKDIANEETLNNLKINLESKYIKLYDSEDYAVFAVDNCNY